MRKAICCHDCLQHVKRREELQARISETVTTTLLSQRQHSRRSVFADVLAQYLFAYPFEPLDVKPICSDEQMLCHLHNFFLANLDRYIRGEPLLNEIDLTKGY
jgi:hypothetical protein